MNDAKARLLQLISDEPHMAGGGTHWSMGNPEQFAKNKSERLYPKLERMNPAVKAVKNQVDAFNRLVDQGVPIKDLVGGLVGAVPFVGPDMRKRMEGATVNFPTGFERSKKNPQVATGRIDMAPAKVSDILGELKPSDFTGTKGMSNVLHDVGRGYPPNVLDVLDTLGMDITGFGGVGIGTAIKGGRKAAGALSDLAKSETGYKLAQKVINSPYMAPMSMNVVKDTGGNWRGGSVENQLGGLLKAENLDNPEQAKALNKWISSNLTNYVKKQMATPDDPVRKLAEQGITHKPSVLDDYQDALAPREDRVKAGFPAEGLGQSQLARGWENASDDAITSNNAGEIQSAPQRAERMNAAKQKVTQELDALNQKFESRIRNSGLKENEIQGLMRTMTPLEKADMIGDDSFIRANADYLAQSSPVTALQAKIMEDNPWIAKVDPNSSVYTPHLGDLGFDHITDVLNQDLAAGRIRPEQLSKVSMEQAVRRAHEFDQEMAKKMAAAQVKVTEGMPVHKEYPEGYKWIELTSPKKELPSGWSVKEALNPMSGKQFQVFDENGSPIAGAYGKTEESALGSATKQLGRPELEQALKYEGDTMGHCVGGYCPDVIEGRSRIFSLRDAKGEPHVTIETKPGGGHEYAGEKNKEIIRLAEERGIQKYMAPGNEALWAEAEKNLAERGITAPQYIQQIKGKGNRAPKEDYLPFVQDFVKSGDWSDVGDIHNTRLRDLKKTPKVEEYLKSKNADVPRYLTEDEYKGHESDFLLDELGKAAENDPLTQRLLDEQPRMAEGGEVKSFFDEKSAKQRVLELLNHEPNMNNGPYIGSELMPRPLPLQLQGEIANDAFGGIGGGGRATYAHPIGKDAAIRAYIEGGGYKPKDMDYKGQVNNMGISYEKAFNDGGEAHMARGGVLKAIETAQKTAKKSQMYSAVDKALEASKRGAGTGMEFANELAKTSGIKKAELVDRGIMVPSNNGPVLNPALTQLPKMTKQDFVSHLNEKYKPPGVRKITLGNVKFDQLSNQDLYKEYVRIRGSEPEAYGEPMSREDILDELSGAPDEDTTKAKYSKYKLPGGENYRENLYQYENPAGKAFYQSHFDEPNVLYHMRQTDRIEPTYTSAQIDAIGQRMADAMGVKQSSLASGAPILMMRQGVISPVEAAQFSHAKGFRNMDMDVDMSPAQRRALHVEEIQSDWHQKGRDQGYRGMFDRTPEQAERELTVLYDKRSRLIDEAAALPDSEMPKYLTMMEEIRNLGEQASQVSTEWNELLRSNALPNAPFKKNWHEHALKQALMDAAEGGYDQLLITPGAEQAKRYDLSQHVSDIRYDPYYKQLIATGQQGEAINKIAEPHELPNYVGKEVAEKLLQTPISQGMHKLSGLDLSTGGEGMAGFYDKMVPNYLNDLGKKYGVRVGERAIEGDVPHANTLPSIADANRIGGEMFGITDFNSLSKEQFDMVRKAFEEQARAAYTTKLHSFDITPEMREDILNNGLPMYQRGGEVHMGRGGILGAISKAQDTSKAAEKAAEAAAKAAKVVPTPAAPAFIPGLMQKSTAADIGREERARRQAAAAAEAARVEAAKQTPVPVGYVKHTEKSPNPHVGYRYEATQHPGIEQPIPIDLAKLEREKKGASLGVMPWDSQSRNVEVSSISGEPLQTHLYTHAGQPYSLDEKHLAKLIGGASAEEVADAIKTRDMFASKENRERGGTGEVVHAVTTMGQYGENYSHPPSDFAFEIVNRRRQEGRLRDKDLQALNNSIRTFQDNKRQVAQGIFPYANFAGFETPEGLQQIYTGGLGLSTSSGNLRKAIAKRLHKVGTQELLGFNSEDLINATTVPSLRGVDKGYIGGTLLSNDIGNAGFYGPRKDRFGMELAPAEGFPYNSPYSTDFSARYYGQLPDLVPLDVVMHRQLAPIEQGLLARENKKPYTAKSLRNSAIGSLEKSNEGVSQIMDARFFQDLADYFDALNKPLEKKKGGLAQTKKVKRHGNTVSN
jgi:hypothetical protein